MGCCGFNLPKIKLPKMPKLPTLSELLGGGGGGGDVTTTVSADNSLVVKNKVDLDFDIANDVDVDVYLDNDELAKAFQRGNDLDEASLKLEAISLVEKAKEADEKSKLQTEQFKLARLSLKQQKTNNMIMIGLTLTGLVIMIKKKGG